ncbi:MAG: bifunctional metallophosphatase/5'-nucleotidase [Rubrivivax sp.]|nr:bifunctional metallophosphatase/5'-nucleotidase [Rubrivivax sp.]MCL4697944.1 5'-nucleotidase C-terminal domain-containing protein [Burkholderiaceae bacterium]
MPTWKPFGLSLSKPSLSLSKGSASAPALRQAQRERLSAVEPGPKIVRFARFAVTAAAITWLAGCALEPPRPTEPVHVKVLAINDFHGNLKPSSGGIRIKDPADATKTVVVPAGGSEHLATLVAQVRAKSPNHIFVAAGDLVGATPLLSALFRDEPTIESLGLMGLEVSAVGNHEFDKGADELLRLQAGGCSVKPGSGSAEPCQGPHPFKGAAFKYLAASTVVNATGRTLLPPYHVKRFQGIPVAFIGLTLKDTPTIVVPDGVRGLAFRDEAETVNALVPELKKQGIEAIVVLIHEGGAPAGDYNECPGISGPIVDIVGKLDRAVDLVVSGHTHRAYNCRIAGRLVTSADKYGTVLSEIDLVLDPKTGDVTSARADNLIVRTTLAKDAQQTALIATYERLAAPLARRVVGRLGAPLVRTPAASGESPLGQVIADAQLAATAREFGAQIALMNPGGIRADLGARAGGAAGDLQVRYEDLFAVQPFYNNLVTMTLSGLQLMQVLEQQWINQPTAAGRVLAISRGFAYAWDASKPPGQRIVPGSMKLNGNPIAVDTPLRVTVNGFLAGGGDNFTVLLVGRERRTGMMDVDAFEAHVKANPGLVPGALDRITRAN